MSGVAVSPGDGGEILASASQAVGTTNTEDFWMLRGGGAIITIVVTSVGAAGSIDSLNIQAKNGSNYDTVIAFLPLGLVAAGRYRYRIGPGAVDADLWDGITNDYMPVAGRVSIVQSGNAVVYSVNIHAIGS